MDAAIRKTRRAARVAASLTLGAAALTAHAQTPGQRLPPLPPGQKFAPRRPGLLPPRPGSGLFDTDLLSQISPPDTPEAADPFGYPEADRLVLQNDGTAEAMGNVRFRFKGNTVTCDRARFRRRDGIAICEGHVVLETPRQTVRAARIEVNTRNQDFDARDASTVVPADLAGLLEDLHLAGGRIRREGNTITVENGFLTTCDLLRPHAQLGFSRATLILKRRLILRDTTAYRYERPVLRIRHLGIPITEEKRTSYLPTFGRTNEEGYFVKAAIGYSLSQLLPGLLRVDLMERKGIGLGFDQVYQSPATDPQSSRLFAGRVNLYTLRDQNRGVNNLNARVEHEQRLGAFDARLTTDLSSNSYQAALANTRSRSTSLTLTRAAANPSSLGFTLTGSDSGFAKSDASAWTFTQAIRLPGDGRANLRLTRNDNSTTSASGTQSVTVSSLRETADLTANAKLGIFDAQLQANRNLTNRQSGGTGQSAFFAGTEKLPDLRLSLRQPPRPLSAFLSTATLGYGRFLENAFVGGQRRPLDTDRLLFDATLRSIDQPIARSGLRLRAAARFQQTVYDGYQAAQYLLDHNSSVTLPLGERSEWSVAYRYLRPYGGTPVGFRLDQSGSSNSVSTGLNINQERLQLSVGTAYDIERARTPLFPGLPRQPWTNLQFALGIQPSDRFVNRLQAGYDINTGRLLSVSETFQLRGSEDSVLDAGANYDPRLKRFAQITARFASWVFGRGTRIGAQASYSGFSKRFDYRTLTVAQEFHDYVLTIAYVDQPFGFRSEKGINLSIRLKAFGSAQSGTGGRNGSAPDTGLGGFGNGLAGGSGFGSGFGGGFGTTGGGFGGGFGSGGGFP